MNKTDDNQKFEGLLIAEKILGVLGKMGLDTPTPIQVKSIPVAIGGQDLMGIAQTGTGKTFAFGIPMIQRLALYKGRGLVLLPTRELAQQVDENLKKVGSALGLRTAVFIGGEPIGKQISTLKNKPHILVATPGRLIDHIKRKTADLRDVKILVLDEADMMFDMGFIPQIEEILKYVPEKRQTMLFSATMPPAVVRLVAKYMAMPVNVEIAPTGTTSENVDQEIFVMRKEDRLMHLEKVLKQYSGSVLIFARTKHNAKNLTKSINLMGHQVAEIHSNRSLGQRREALAGFKTGKHRILVATDIAARGIDVTDIELVINYDLPEKSIDYVHRIGRTARAGKRGKAISFALTSQGPQIRSIEALIKQNLSLTKFAELTQTKVFSSRSIGGRRRTYLNSRYGRPAKATGQSPNRPNRGAPQNRSRSTGPGRKTVSKPASSDSNRYSTTDKQRYRASIKPDRRR